MQRSIKSKDIRHDAAAIGLDLLQGDGCVVATGVEIK